MTPAPRDGVAATPATPLADAIEAALPQTQCTRCGYPDCHGYAEAIAAGAAPINRCPPGGREGIVRLARLTGRPVTALDPAHGSEGPRVVAVIEEDACIGCTLCIQACPVDCIVGAPKRMHTVVAGQCTGCELCVPACPVDCITLRPASGARTGWAAWSQAQADEARRRHDARRERERRQAASEAARLAAASPPRSEAGAMLTGRSAVVDAALARARAARIA